ncbi:MAG TPA: NUDIX domain-containing protein [Patescibacteria group bacterium]
MPTSKISLDHAKPDKLFYFVANVVVYRKSDGRCLLLKRSEREKVHPGKYAIPGGKLEWANLDSTKATRLNGDVIDFDNAVEDLIAREVFEEAGITVSSQLTYLRSVAFIRPDGVPVILVKFAAMYESGDVKLEEGAFSDFVWVNSAEVVSYACIDGIHDEVKRTISLFTSNNE